MRISKIPRLFVWFVYTVAVGCGFMIVAQSVSQRLRFNQMIGFGAGVGIMGALWLLARLYRRQARRSKKLEKSERMISSEATEIMILAAGLGATVLIRFACMAGAAANEFYEAAQVVAGQFQPAAVHNCHRVYLYLLHGALMLFGNHVYAGVFLQTAMQTAGVFFFYLAVRKLSGVPAAMVTLFFWGFSPYMMTESMQFSPIWLFLLAYGAALWRIVSVSESQWRSQGKGIAVSRAVFCVSTGLLIGFCCYLDIIGFTLLIFLTGMIWFSGFGFWKNRAVVFAGCLAAVVVSILVLYGIGFGSTGSLPAAIRAQIDLYRLGHFQVSFRIPKERLTWDIPLLTILMAVGIFSIFYRRRSKERAMWLLSAIVLMGMQRMGMVYDKPFSSFTFLFVICSVMAGCSVAEVFYIKERRMKSDNNEIGQEKKDGEDGGINFIENPLPLPKKHEKKILDYDYQVADDDDFDLP